jgi:DNA polymerase-3 subunit gamma/tau
MSAYVALARKWRPRRFSEMSGQEHVLRALSNALAQGRVHHAYLFAGTRGVGKTTVARILAKCLNCERGVAVDPCGECASCRDIDAGRSLDVLEVDAASRTKIEDTRELLENVTHAPMRGRYKIYLIDEVHMLSDHSFNALLKTLEEPPPHVKFLLATTVPQYLPVTVRSRCLQFNLKRLAAAVIAARLRQILEAEQIGYEAPALQLLALEGDGSLRDALSLLDQLLVYGGGRVLEADARSMLGSVARDQVVQLARLLAAGDAAGLAGFAVELEERGAGFDRLLAQLATLLERVAFRQHLTDYGGDELHPPELLAELAAAISAEDVQLYYQTALLGRRDLELAPDAGTGFRMTLLRMLAFRPGPQNAGRPGIGGAAAGRAAMASDSAAAGRALAGTTPTQRLPTGAASASAAAAVGPVGDWTALLAALDLQGAPRQLAANCLLLGCGDGTVRLTLDPRNALLRTKAQEEKLSQALARHFGRPIRLEIELGEAALETPARAEERAQAQRQAQAQAAFEEDDTVGALKRRFSANVLPDSVRPADNDS